MPAYQINTPQLERFKIDWTGDIEGKKKKDELIGTFCQDDGVKYIAGICCF